ncbi:MAG: precorrin-8X methylmutase [Rhizobiaceae bacterium]
MSSFEYIHDPAEIYRRSFATVEAEAGLDRLPQAIRSIATRLIHSCGMVNIIDDLDHSSAAVAVGQAALQEGKPIYCDVEMVRSGIIQRLLPAENQLICTLNDKPVSTHAKAIGNTRSAAAVEFWGDGLQGAVVVIGNAPTALFRLLELITAGGAKPALVIGIPVGFIGAVESKQALAENSLEIDFITVHGRRGGSAMASAVLNAIAGGLE